MVWSVEFTDQFRVWWSQLSTEEQTALGHKVLLLEQRGPLLGRPHADTLKGARLPNLKELRAECRGGAYRVLFAFDPRRVAILLWGGRKTSEDFYEAAIPEAEKLSDQHLAELRKEGILP